MINIEPLPTPRRRLQEDAGSGGFALRGRRARAARAEPGSSLARASALMDDPLYGRSGEYLGTISELLLDLRCGRIAYAVMVWDGFMGLRERLFAIPFGALKVDEARQCWVIDADRSRFEDAPVFDQAHWPDHPDAPWHEAVHRHFGAAPYWIDQE